MFKLIALLGLFSAFLLPVRAQSASAQIQLFKARLDTIALQRKELSKPEGDTLRSAVEYRNDMNKLHLQIVELSKNTELQDAERNTRIAAIESEIENLSAT